MPLHELNSADADLPQSPIRQRETTPRPSISPLSAKASPVAMKDTAMQELDIATSTIDTADNDDTRSSSLSDPEDDDDLKQDDTKNLGATAQEHLVHQSLEADSEAETERLDQTPDKRRIQADYAAGRTPSKLSHAATADDDLSDPSSPLSAKPGPDVPAVLLDKDLVGKKRKRSDTADSSLSSADSNVGGSPRKRSHSSGEGNTAIVVSSTAAHIGHEDPSKLVQVTSEDQQQLIDAQDVAIVSPIKPGRGRKPGKQKGKPRKDIPKDAEQEGAVAIEQPSEELSAEAIAKSAEELKHKPTASAIFEDLAKQFTAFREKMHNEKLAALNAELELLNRPDCKHPEFIRQIACVDSRYQKQVSESKAFYKFKLETLRRTTLGERSQLHSQYFQHARELREDIMYQLGEDWYSIQKERRQSNQEKDDAYVHKFPSKRSVQIKQQAKYNQEVSVLSGIARYVGFPAAPDIRGADGDALEDDLKAMKLSKRVQLSNTNQQPVYIPNRSGLLQGQSDRIAHEQFIEQNPWARPQGVIQNHGTPNLTHTPDWAAEPGAHSAKALTRNLNGGIVPRVSSPYTTPMPQRRTQLDSSSGTVPLNSEVADQPSSMVTTKLQHGQLDQGSPLVVSKHRPNGTELTGFRNISNISGTSTIDAPPDSAEKERELQSMSNHITAPQHIFETSPLPRNGVEARRQHHGFSNAHFRPQEGTYGGPAPLPRLGQF